MIKLKKRSQLKKGQNKTDLIQPRLTSKTHNLSHEIKINPYKVNQNKSWNSILNVEGWNKKNKLKNNPS
jgi:hypothetical protein